MAVTETGRIVIALEETGRTKIGTLLLEDGEVVLVVTAEETPTAVAILTPSVTDEPLTNAESPSISLVITPSVSDSLAKILNETPVASLYLTPASVSYQSKINETPSLSWVWLDSQHDIVAVIVTTANASWYWFDSFTSAIEDVQAPWVWSALEKDTQVFKGIRNPQRVGSSVIDEVVLNRQ